MRILFISLLFVLSASAWSSAQESPFKGAADRFVDKDGNLNYLAPWQYLLKNDSTFDKNMYLQAYATYASFLGEPHLLNKTQPKGGDLEKFEFADPYKIIMPRAKNAPVVILNESHHIPMHRAFAMSMLDSLYKAGFSILSLEALAHTDSTLNSRQYPVAATGFYIREPLFGNFIRAAIAKGFMVVGHEVKPEQEIDSKDWIARSNFRDSVQAVNILATMRKYPNQKVFVYVGYDHILEQERGKFKRMATYLKESGIDALTIDQDVRCNCDKDSLAKSAALTTDGAEPVTTGSRKGFVDIQVVHPGKASNSVSEFIKVYNGYKETEILIPKKYLTKKLLIQVYNKAEFAESKKKAIPVFQSISHGDSKSIIAVIPESVKEMTVLFTPFD